MATRRYPRFQVDLPITLTKYWDETPIGMTHGRCRVLAEGGLGATIANDLYVGEVVRLQLARLGGMYASVRYTRGHQYGFEFALMTELQRRAIRQLCETQAASAD